MCSDIKGVNLVCGNFHDRLPAPSHCLLKVPTRAFSLLKALYTAIKHQNLFNSLLSVWATTVKSSDCCSELSRLLNWFTWDLRVDQSQTINLNYLKIAYKSDPLHCNLPNCNFFGVLIEDGNKKASSQIFVDTFNICVLRYDSESQLMIKTMYGQPDKYTLCICLSTHRKYRTFFSFLCVIDLLR